MDLKDLCDLSDKISVPPICDEEMLRKCRETYYIRCARKRKIVSFSILPILAVIIICMNMFLAKPEIEVYAMNKSSKVLLKNNEQVILDKQITPMGYGYQIELSVPKGEYMITLTDEKSESLENVFSNENIIYWFPDGISGGDFRDDSGKEIILPKTSISVFNINVFKGDNKIAAFKVKLEKKDNFCNVTLLELK